MMPTGVWRRTGQGWLAAAVAVWVWLLGAGWLGAQQAHAGESAPVLAVTVPGAPLVELGGRWQFHLGDDPRWASPGFDDSGWKTVTTDKGWDVQGYPDHGGFAWYRRHLHLAANDGAHVPLALESLSVAGVAEVFWNGTRIGSCGKFPLNERTVICWEPIHVPTVAASGDVVLAVRIWSIPGYNTAPPGQAGLFSPVSIGSRDAVEAATDQGLYRFWRSLRVSNVLGLLYGVAAVLALAAYLLNRQEPLYLWLSVLLVATAFRTVLRLWMDFGGLPWELQQFWVWVGGYGIILISLYLFLLRLFGLSGERRWRRITLTLLFIAILTGFCLSVETLRVSSWTAADGLAFRIVWWVESLAELCPLGLIVAGLRRRTDPARWAVAITATLAVLWPVVYNIFQLLQRWDLAEGKLDVVLFHIAGGIVRGRELSTLLLLIALSYAAVETLRAARRQHLETELEVRSAHEVQQILVPETLPAIEGYALTSAYYPAREVGGDFYQVISLEDASTLVLIGDVSGKGLRAGMMVALITGAIRTAAEVDAEPAAVLGSLNRRLCGRMQGGFVTCLALRMFPDGRCALANAGHLPPVVHGQEMEMPGALPLGLDPEAEYTQVGLRLQEGETMTLFTDGVPEARSAHGELFGFERAVAAMAGRPGAEGIARQARMFGQEDDITVLTVERVGESVVPVALRSQVVTAG